MRRYLESLFRYRKLFLVPVLAVPIISMLTALYVGKEYEIRASLWVSPSPFLTAPADPRSLTGPNETQAQALREWLAMESFRQAVMDRVGLTTAIEMEQWPVPSRLQQHIDDSGLASVPGLRSVLSMMNLTKPSSPEEAMGIGLSMVRQTVHVDTAGKNTLLVTYTGKEPLLGKRLVEETVALFNEKTVSLRANEAKSGIEFYTEQVRIQGERLTQAALAVQQFEETHPLPRGAARPLAEQQELDLLRRQVTLEETAYETVLGKLEEVRLKGEAAVTGENQSFQVVDAPKAPPASGLSKKALLMSGILGAILGAMLGLLPVLFLTWTDTRVRTREDLEQALQPAFIAEVPLLADQPGSLPKNFVRLALARGSDQPL